jgi:HSP20 family protein
MANITRYNPFNDFVSLRDAMDRLFEDSVISPRAAGVLNTRGVHANLYENTEGYTIQMPMPGVKAEDLEVTVQQDVVSLKWQTSVQIPEGVTVHYNGIQTGKYQQSFTLPSPINAEKVEAHYSNGILTLQLPKTANAQAHTIKVTTL